MRGRYDVISPIRRPRAFARAGRNGDRAGQPEGRAVLLRSAVAGEAFSTAHRRRPVGLGRCRSIPVSSGEPARACATAASGRAHSPGVVVSETAGSGRFCTHLYTRCGPTRGFPVERLQMLEGGVFPQAPVRLPNGSPRWPQEVVDEWVEAHRCDNGERRGHGRVLAAVAQFPTSREVAIQRSVSRPTVRKMLEGGVFPRLPETGSVNHLPARRDCSATATRSPVLQPGAAPALFAGGPPVAKE